MNRPPAGEPKGLLDTSVVIDYSVIPEGALPHRASISSITLAELSQGPHLTDDPGTRALRLERLQELESAIPSVIPFGAAEARIYGSLVGLVVASGRLPRARRLDLMIAATAAAHDLPLYTRNGPDFLGLEGRVRVVVV